MARMAVIAALLLSVSALAPLATATPFVCFVDVTGHCVAGYDTPPLRKSCGALAPGQEQREQVFVDPSHPMLQAGHKCSRDADGKSSDSTYVFTEDASVEWGAKRHTDCDIAAVSPWISLDTDSPCPGGQRIPDVLP